MRHSAWVVLIAFAAFAFGMVVEGTRGQAQPRMRTDVLLSLGTGEVPRPTRVRAHLNHWPPGSETGWHVHPGPTVFLTLEGELEELLPGGQTRKLMAGQALWHPPRHEHNVRNPGDRPARALAVHLDPDRPADPVK